MQTNYDVKPRGKTIRTLHWLVFYSESGSHTDRIIGLILIGPSAWLGQETSISRIWAKRCLPILNSKGSLHAVDHLPAHRDLIIRNIWWQPLLLRRNQSPHIWARVTCGLIIWRRFWHYTIQPLLTLIQVCLISVCADIMSCWHHWLQDIHCYKQKKRENESRSRWRGRKQDSLINKIYRCTIFE